ncbi:unnamed protein product [Nyctereutes procyonoides]|uniref:(raccoon dog) hypothetical protein n=1 Tax=Nyctereutes procyonoides TaxID=34880 RepID=A0A811Y5K1_NYCPR|nr:unnamed protein product [Nyctereutes procyonoides]
MEDISNWVKMADIPAKAAVTTTSSPVASGAPKNRETSPFCGRYTPLSPSAVQHRTKGRSPPWSELVGEAAMGTSQSKTDPKTPLGGASYSIVAWPQYQLDNQSQWPREGTFDCQVLTDLDNLCRCQGKWSEVPYVQAFWTLRSRPSLCSLCSTSQVLLARSPPLTLLSTSPKDPDPSARSPLSEPPENLSSPSVRAPLLPPPPPYHTPVPQPPVPLVPQQNPNPTPISLTPTTPETPQLKATAEPTPQEDPLTSPPISTRTGSHNPSPDLVCPLQEVAGAEGVVRVHAPFSFQDLSQIVKCLGSFSANPDNFIKEFQYLAQVYDLTWHDLHVVQTTTLTTEERKHIQAAAREHGDQVHLTDATMPVGTQVVPAGEPGWDYQNGQAGAGIGTTWSSISLPACGQPPTRQSIMTKIREIIQTLDKNPAMFLSRLTEALTQYTLLDPASLAGATVLATHLISQSAPDIRKKLKRPRGTADAHL